MRFSIILALLPLVLATPIPDNASSRAANQIKDNANRGADVANKEIDAIQKAQSAIKNGQSPKAAEQELQNQLNKGVDIRKQNQALVNKLPKRADDGEDATVVEVSTSTSEDQDADAALEARASKQEAAKTLGEIEQKQNGAQDSVNKFKGNAGDAASLEALRKSFQGGNAKLSSNDRSCVRWPL